MKFIFLMGGTVGFLAAASSGLAAGRSPNRVLFDAAVGCLVGALVFRWFWSVLLRGYRETYVARQRAAAPAPPKNNKP
jgi:hypothetical protein